jgi:hypothetical protein
MKTGYGPAAEWMDFERIVRLIRDAEDPEADAYRYWLNRPRAAASHWLNARRDQRGADGGGGPSRLGARSIAAGFDGSENDDHTALWAAPRIGCSSRSGSGRRGRPTMGGSPREVDEAVDWAFENFRVVRFYGDPPWWQEEMGEWAAALRHDPVAEFWTNRDTPMAVACGAFLRTALRQGRRATINPDPAADREPQTTWQAARGLALRERPDGARSDQARGQGRGGPRRPQGAPRIAAEDRQRPGLRLARFGPTTDAVKLGLFEEPVHERAVW